MERIYKCVEGGCGLKFFWPDPSTTAGMVYCPCCGSFAEIVYLKGKVRASDLRIKQGKQ